ncbi:MAG: aspartate--tRNA ligase [Clostridia bacterium]
MKEFRVVENRTHMCTQLSKDDCSKVVKLFGWVQKRRNLGGLIFIDLRDRSGIIQLAIDPESSAFDIAESTRSEYVIAVKGIVRKRPEGQVNTELKTGAIEVLVEEMEILNTSLTPPFYIEDDVNAEESLKLKYRYLDLRRPKVQNALIMRHKIVKSVRDFLDDTGFIEVETPILTKSTPEGARDYLVPSRVHKGSFYALPQSPQLFKQLLMISGFDRYFQIVKCFRDEDLRADRQPEFTQIDIELSFAKQKDIRNLAEQMVKYVFSRNLDIEVSGEFPIMTYDEAMSIYGSDKPDTRFDMILKDISTVFTNTKFRVFSNVIESDGSIKAIKVEGQKYSRKDIDQLTDFVKKYGAKGLVWIQKEDSGVRSSISKFLTEEEIDALTKELSLQTGDFVFVVADSKKVANKALGALRLEIAKAIGLIDKDKFNFLWIVDFPLFEFDEEDNRFYAAHHPFTMPYEEDLSLMESNPEKVRAQAYDLVLNGAEIAGGSLRIYNSEIQKSMLKTLGFSEKEASDQFGFLIDALDYGAPPHGGIAFGLDRLVMEMLGISNIRDVIAFPKTTSASCLLTDAPNEVSKTQLEELGLLINKES